MSRQRLSFCGRSHVLLRGAPSPVVVFAPGTIGALALSVGSITCLQAPPISLPHIVIICILVQSIGEFPLCVSCTKEFT